MARKLFCQISPLAYKISVFKCQKLRSIKDIFSKTHFAKDKQKEPLAVLVYAHNSLIRRKLGDVNMQLQENKAINLSLVAPKVTNVLIKPGADFFVLASCGLDAGKIRLQRRGSNIKRQGYSRHWWWNVSVYKSNPLDSVPHAT